ncbi:MAG: SDR family oxidoreductase [Xanthomonadales bacterium]|nr:SDR family oxidoreductase [Xanthomonadales bacterium]
MAGKTSSTRPWALVTGASAGIGAEFARQLAERGYNTVLVARRAERLQELALYLRERYAVDCLTVPLDLARADSVAELEGVLADEQVEVEFLVSNAGYGVPGLFTQPDWQAHADSLQVMLTGVCELTWRLLPGMQRRGKGYVVNVASLAGLVPGSARHTLYGATKAFLIRFSESLAAENLETGVNVSALCPGFTHSEFHDVIGTREQVSKMPSWMWMDAPEVVRYGIESVVRDDPRVIAIPGYVNQTIAALARKLPYTLTQAMIKKEARRWRAQD